MAHAAAHNPITGGRPSPDLRGGASNSTLRETSPFAEPSRLRRLWRYFLIGLRVPDGPPRIISKPEDYYRRR